jgi:hypothetical protein
MSIFRSLVVIAILFALVTGGYGATGIGDCPVGNVKNNVFDASALGKSQ